MTVLLFYDLNKLNNPENKFNNPNQLFQYSSFHGSIWQCSSLLSYYLLFHINSMYLFLLAYTVESIGESSTVINFTIEAKPYFIGACIVAAAFVA